MVIGTGPSGIGRVEDIHQMLKALPDAGATIHDDARDVGGGKRQQ
jgi:hypothetical protein